MESVLVLGAGSWGTALAHHLGRSGHLVRLWTRSPELVEMINSTRENPNYFPTFVLHEKIKAFSSLAEACSNVALVVVCLPSHVVSSLADELGQHLSGRELIVSAAKGLDEERLETMSQLLERRLKRTADTLAVISGPSFAKEVLEGKPTAVTVASTKIETAEQIAKFFHCGGFRVYTSTDVLGVEYSGVLKNVIAIAVGIVDGLEVGLNARAALITRGLAEIQRFVSAMGGDRLTVAGLSGLGDLLLTATGPLSRNRQVGFLLGRGKTLSDSLQTVKQVAEGVRNAEIVFEIARRNSLEMPIVQEVVAVLRGLHSAKESVQILLARSQKRENLS